MHSHTPIMQTLKHLAIAITSLFLIRTIVSAIIVIGGLLINPTLVLIPAASVDPMWVLILRTLSLIAEASVLGIFLVVLKLLHNKWGWQLSNREIILISICAGVLAILPLALLPTATQRGFWLWLYIGFLLALTYGFYRLCKRIFKAEVP